MRKWQVEKNDHGSDGMIGGGGGEDEREKCMHG